MEVTPQRECTSKLNSQEENQPAFREGTVNRKASGYPKMEGIEYQGQISLDQLISYKKRASKDSSKVYEDPKLPSPVSPLIICRKKEFSDDFYDSIETFLDQEAVFIVSPTSAYDTKNNLKLMKAKSFNLKECVLEKAASEKSKYQIESQSNQPIFTGGVSMQPLRKSASDINDDGGPFLGKIGTSSLLQRRKKFETMGSMDSITEKKHEENL